MAIYNKFRKSVSKARKGIRSAAKKSISVRRKYNVVKRGKLSTMGIQKALSNLSRRMSVAAELKTIDSTDGAGSPDVALRQFFALQASANQATLSTTVTPGISGYLVRQLPSPSQGDGAANYDGQKYMVNSINWKGTMSLLYTTNANGGPPAFVKLYIVQHNDNVDQAFNMSEFLEGDNHGEYSTMSRRGRDDLKDYKVVAYKQIKLSYGNLPRIDFNITCNPNTIIRHEDSSISSIPKRFYCVAVVSPDIADRLTTVHYTGQHRIRFTH